MSMVMYHTLSVVSPWLLLTVTAYGRCFALQPLLTGCWVRCLLSAEVQSCSSVWVWSLGAAPRGAGALPLHNDYVPARRNKASLFSRLANAMESAALCVW